MMAAFSIQRSPRLQALVLELKHTNAWEMASHELFRMIYTQQPGMFIAKVPIGDRRLVKRRDWITEAWARVEAKGGER